MASKYQEWTDLFKHKPDSSDLEDIRKNRGHDLVGSKVQRMKNASAKEVNIDKYLIEIIKLPTGYNTTSLIENVRKNLANFLDSNRATFEGYTSGDAEDWKDGAKLGCLMLFKIPLGGPIHEQAAVIVSKTDQTSWIFSPVTIGAASPGEHPVSGNRHFGISLGGSSEGVKATIFTRAADRAIDNIFPPYDTVYDGGHKLWLSFQEKVKTFINNNGGQARIVKPETYRPKWSDPDVQIII